MTSYARTGYLGFVRRTELTQSDGGRILFHAYAHLPVTFHLGLQTGLVMQSDCISGGREFDPGPVPYFCGD